jgi:predicted phosphodiesterase
MGDFHWLHFSDLHLTPNANFNTAFARERLIDFLAAETKAGRLQCDYIFITGDIANKNDYSGAKKFIGELFRALNWTSDKYSNVFWAVGNHDISRENMLRNYIIEDIRKPAGGMRLFEEKMKDGQSREALLSEGMRDFTGWLKDSGFQNEAGRVRRAVDPPSEIEKKNIEAYHRVYATPDLNVVALNTCLTSYDTNDENNLYITEPGLLSVFNNIDAARPTYVIGHHGMDFMSRETRESLGHLLSVNNVGLYLCGHTHRLGYDEF